MKCQKRLITKHLQRKSFFSASLAKLTKLIGLFTTETVTLWNYYAPRFLSAGKIHGFEVFWLTSGQKGDFSPLENCILCRRKWMALTLISSFLLSSPELMMVCDQYFPYIYYFYTHLLRARASKLPIGMHFFFYPKNIKTLLLLGCTIISTTRQDDHSWSWPLCKNTKW